MGNTSETGRASKLSAFGDLKNFLNSLQPAYNPPADDLKIDSLNQVHERAISAHQEVSAMDAAYRIALNKRNLCVKPLNNVVRSSVNLILALNLGNGQTPKMKSLANAITGNNKVSQQSIDARLDHFNQYIDLLRSLDGYTPEREGLQIPSLEALHAEISNANQEVGLKESALVAARMKRDEVFGAEDGLIMMTRRVKLYLKSLFGERSDGYKQVVRITKVLKR